MSRVGPFFRHRAVAVEQGSAFDRDTPRGSVNSVGSTAATSIACARRFRTSEDGPATPGARRVTRAAYRSKTRDADIPMYGTGRDCALTLPDERTTMSGNARRIVRRSSSLRTGDRLGRYRDARELQPVMTTIPDGAYDAGALDVTFDLVHP